LADKQGSVEVHADDRVDHVGVHFVKSIAQYSRAVDEYADAAERVERRLADSRSASAVATVSWLACAGQAHPLRQPEVRCVTGHSNGLP
jgi:hypothetical protein